MEQFGALIRKTESNRSPKASGIILHQNDLSQEFVGFNPERIRAPKLTLASMLLDTSYSMQNFVDQDGITQNGPSAVINCHSTALIQFRNYKNPRHAIALGCWGFNWQIHPYQPANEIRSLNGIYKAEGNTPLYDTLDHVFNESLSTYEKIRAQRVSCNLAYLILSDGQEAGSTRINFEQAKARIAQILRIPNTIIYGIGMGEAGCHELRKLGIPIVMDVSRSLGLEALFTDFTTMTMSNNAVIRPSYDVINEEF